MKHLKILIICLLVLALPSIICGQSVEKYNLSFDHYDSVNQKMPNGWFSWGELKQVSREKLENERYVVKVISDQPRKFGTVTYSIPANYMGDTITLTGKVKHEDVKGYVGILMRIDGANGSLGFKSTQRLRVKGTKDWKEYTIKLPLHPQAKVIYVAGILSGKGTAWFDDFRVAIDGENIQVLEETRKLYLRDFSTDKFNNALENSSTPIDLTNDIALSFSLNGLIESLGDKQIVAIGESTHGTSEFYQLREVITKRLIEEKGFNLVVLESPYDDIELLNQGLAENSLDDLMKNHLFSIYQTEEMKSFLQWYDSNLTEYDLSFKGIDDSFWVFHELLTDGIGVANDKKLSKLLSDLKSNIAKGTTANGKKGLKLNVSIYNNIVSIENQLETTANLTDPLKEILLNGKSSFINYIHVKNKKPIQSRDEIMADRIFT